jgi:hypothetical protein
LFVNLKNILGVIARPGLFITNSVSGRMVAKPLRFYYYLSMSSEYRYLKFGRFLLDKKLITAADVINARILQKNANLRIGQLARLKGLLTAEEVEKILILQEDTYEKFGEIAVRENYLTIEKVEALLKEQKDVYLFFGEALVQLGVITEAQLIEELKEFNQTKIKGATV